MGYCLRNFLNVTGYDSRDKNDDDNNDDEDNNDNLLSSKGTGGGKESFFWMDIVYQSAVKEKSINEKRKLVITTGRYWRKQQQ
mmetsp:Transcript_39013/g.44913  ORF Transcript_39013/g.44913 Transcript_39013/m.44913 type:complete len:83 (-) Transcript_39013:115-363(-)